MPYRESVSEKLGEAVKLAGLMSYQCRCPSYVYFDMGLSKYRISSVSPNGWPSLYSGYLLIAESRAGVPLHRH